jgi:Flp pilus assembly pilin Flp
MSDTIHEPTADPSTGIDPTPGPVDQNTTLDVVGRLADDTGAQAMEYAMLGGAGVASVSVLTWLMRQPWFEEAIQEFFTGLFGSLLDRIGDLLPAFGAIV